MTAPAAISASVWKRDYTGIEPTAQGLTLAPTRYSWAAVGGPEAAEINVSGLPTQLWGVLGWLRCPIEIVDGLGRLVWYGYVSEIELQTGALSIGLSLDDMWTAVKVAYERRIAGQTTSGARATTAWATDATSAAQYGTKERIISLSGLTDTEAEQYRDRFLADVKWPIPALALGASGTPGATLRCHGWWQTLDWRLYGKADAGSEKNSAWPDEFQTFAKYASSDGVGPTVAQGFTLSYNATLHASRVGFLLCKHGTPGSDCEVGIYSDSGGAPNTRLAYATVDPDQIGYENEAKRFNWLYKDLNVAVDLTYGTDYWLQWKRVDGSQDSSNYYRLGHVDDSIYAGGDLYGYPGAWTALGHDAVFAVDGTWTTAQFVQQIIAAEGEFVTAVDVDNASGLYLNPQRNGDLSALAELEKLIDVGTTNDRRLLFTVVLAGDKTRRLRMWEEPAAASADWRLILDGTILDAYGKAVDPCLCPVGVWVRLNEVIPGQFSQVAKEGDHRRLFVERSEYTVASGQARLYPRGRRMPWDIGAFAL